MLLKHAVSLLVLYLHWAKGLKEAAESQKAVLERSMGHISIAQAKCIRLAELVRADLEDTVGGDLVNLLSLCTRATP